MTTKTYLPFDLKKAASPHRLLGLWRLMHGYQFIFIIAEISLGIAAMAKNGSYWLLRYFVNTLVGKGFGAYDLPLIALGFILLATVQSLFSFLSGNFAAKTSEGTTQRLRDYIFDHIQRLNFTYHDKTDTGDLIQRSTSDVDALRRFYADQAINAGRIAMWFIVNFIALLFINVQLAFVSIIAVPILIVVSIFFFKRIRKAYKAYQEQEAVMTTTLQENLSGVRVVKAFARQDYEKSKFEHDNWENYLRGRKLVNLHSVFWPISDVICGVQTIAGYLIGAWMAIQGTISLGDYLAYAGMVVWIIFPMRNLGRLIVQMSAGLVSYDRVFAIINEEREPLDEGDYVPETGIIGDLTFEHMSFQYDAANPVLQDINFHCNPGQVIALLGSTGSGKTTLVNLLPRFYEYTNGSIRLDDIDLNRYPRRYLRQNIGIVEQEPFLFSRSIRENITYGVGRKVEQDELEAAARSAAIHDVILDTLGGYDTLVGERGVTLSGGQKQRVAIARTLLKNPRILILDDATSSVDIETEAEIRDALQNLMKDRTTFIIAHRIQSVMDADQILVLDKGRIVQQGTHTELLEKQGFYKKIFDIQARIEVELEEEISSVY
jgi:ATP-binding cassette, subfamily B, bacterial